jgi:hypothetical protein
MSSVRDAVPWLKFIVVPQGVSARLEGDTRLVLEGRLIAAWVLAF